MCSPGNIVKLNVGGTVFQTSKATLTGINGFFRMMLESDIPLQTDASNCIFVDRSPKHFDLILNFLRGGDVDFPEQGKELKEVRKEAQFYLLEGLVDLCDRKLNKAISLLKSATDKLEFQMKSDKPRLIIDIVEFRKSNFNIAGIMEKYGDKLNIAFR